MQHKPVFWSSCPPFRIFFEICLSIKHLKGWKPHALLGMRDSDCRAQNYRNLEFFRKLKGFFYHFLRFLRSRRIVGRHLGKHGKEPGILLGLRAVGSWVIAANYDETSDNTSISRTHKRIRSNIKSYLLHRNCCPLPCQACCQSVIEGNLFIRWPLNVSVQAQLFFEFNYRRNNFRARCSRVWCNYMTSGFNNPSCYGDITQ